VPLVRAIFRKRPVVSPTPTLSEKRCNGYTNQSQGKSICSGLNAIIAGFVAEEPGSG